MPISKVALFSNEYPPNVYGGAGVHVEYLSKALAERVAVEVRCFGEQDEVHGNLRIKGYQPWPDMKHNTDPRFAAAMGAFSQSLAMAKDNLDADVVHCHTWYTQMGGLLAAKLWNIPFVLTTHSLEPLRPWKAEQLGGGYAVSSFCERTAVESADAVIAVSQGMRRDILACYPAVDPERVTVIHNGIDPDQYRPRADPALLARHGIPDDRPYAIFVGRITRQKGVVHLLDAAEHLPAGVQLVLCAGAPDTKEIAAEFRTRVDELADADVDVIWIDEMLPRPKVIQLLTHASVFVCPSIYEPFGIVNLEAMACGTAVVASAVGGIPEVVVDGETGTLVPLTPGDDAMGSPADPAAYARDLAQAINALLDAPDIAAAMGRAGRERVESTFAWTAIAERTAALYRELVRD